MLFGSCLKKRETPLTIVCINDLKIMIEKVTDAIVLKAKDFRDNDKIVYLFSPSEGKISAVLKGVKKAAAKLKFAGEPFCFAEFTLVFRGEMATVTNCSEISSFFEIRQDIDGFYCGCAVLEIVSAFIEENQPNELLFWETVKMLKNLAEKKTDAKTLLVKFALKVFENFGQKLCFDRCAECGKKIDGNAYFDFSDGGVLCGNCATQFAVPIDESVRKALCNIDALDGDRLVTYKCSDVLLKKTLSFLDGVFKQNFQKINSIKQILQF